MQPALTSESCIAALSYPIWIVALVALFTDVQHNRFVRFHAVQALLRELGVGAPRVGQVLRDEVAEA